MSAPWTDERSKRCADLWMQGLSATEIGMEMGCSRNAVIGRVHRMGLSRPTPAGCGTRRSPKPSAPVWTAEAEADLRRMVDLNLAWTDIARVMKRSQWAVSRRAASLGIKRSARPRKDTPAQAASNRVEFRSMGREAQRRVEAFAGVTDAVPLMARKFGMCAWPVGVPDRPANQLCCGRGVIGDSSYCMKHRTMGTTGISLTRRDISRLAKAA